MNPWELIIQQPLINCLIVVAGFFGGDFGVSIIILTIIINLVLLPFTLSQIRSSKKMTEMQPKLAELQKKYAKDRQRLAQEQMALYKEAGIKPAGCLLGMFIQLPVWIALYQSIMLAMAIAHSALIPLAREQRTATGKRRPLGQVHYLGRFALWKPCSPHFPLPPSPALAPLLPPRHHSAL